MSNTAQLLEISTPQMKLKITIEEVDRLHIHEEVLPHILSWLVEKIRKDGVFKDPVLVDEKTLVVLDGMHRVVATRELGFKYIPVCLVDYDNPSIKLYAWSRVIKATRGKIHGEVDEARKEVLRTLSKLGYRLVTVANIDAGSEMLSRREIMGLLLAGKTPIGLKAISKDIKLIYENIKRVEEALLRQGFEVEYHTERDSMELVEQGSAVAALIPPAITKNEVRAVALRGEVFVHKATRHVIPARPLGINVPLDWLTGKYSLSEVREMLSRHLSRKKITTLPPGTVLDRRYEEELYVFE